MKNVIPGDIYVWARTPTDEFDIEIKKDKDEGAFHLLRRVSPHPRDEYRRHDDLERLVESGLVTRKWARTRMSNVDPIAIDREEQRKPCGTTPTLSR